MTVAILTGHGTKKHPIWPKSVWTKIRNEASAALEILNVSNIIYKELPAVCLDSIPRWEINKIIIEIIKEVNPDEIYMPFEADLHNDHEIITNSICVACRPYLEEVKSLKRVIAYETLSETHLSYSKGFNAFQPNIFIDVTETIDKKIIAMKKYKSQIHQNNMPRSENAIRALATFRGTHIGCFAAEAFILLGEYQR